MKKLQSSITNMVLVLVGVALITGTILAYVNKITEQPIKLQAAKTLANGIKAVMGGTDLSVTKDDTIRQNIDGKEAVFVIHNTAGKNGRPLGAAVESTTGGFGGDLKVLVGFDTKGDILGYTILQHSETPGLGAKADKWFQHGGKGDIIGKNPSTSNLTVKKDGGSVDAITASTITSRAFLKAVSQAYNAYMSKTGTASPDATTSASKQEKKTESTLTPKPSDSETEDRQKTNAAISVPKQEKASKSSKPKVHALENTDASTSASKQEHAAEHHTDASTSASKQEHTSKAKTQEP